MKKRHVEGARTDARACLTLMRANVSQDYHTLNSEQVEQLLAMADIRRYQKPRNANGSRARMFFAHLQRLVRRGGRPMKGYRFYADLPGTLQRSEQFGISLTDKPLLPLYSTVKRLREHAASNGQLNCIALLLGDEHRCHDYSQECLSSVFGHADSDTNLGSVAHEYLRKCRRIPEALARQLHPRLFARLDQEDE